MLKKLISIDTYVIIGQSNAVGTSLIKELNEKNVNYIFNNTLLYQAGEFAYGNEIFANKLLDTIKIGLGFTPNHFGLEYGMASVFETHKTEKVAIIKYAYGTTNLYYNWKPRSNWQIEPKHFSDEGYIYKECCQKIREGIECLVQNGYSPKIKFLCFMQGESDAYGEISNAQNYFENLSILLENLKAEFFLYNLTLLIGEIATDKPNAPFSKIIRDAQKEYCDKNKNAFLIKTNKLILSNDKWHFNGDSMFELGQIFANKILQLEKEAYKR